MTEEHINFAFMTVSLEVPIVPQAGTQGKIWHGIDVEIACFQFPRLVVQAFRSNFQKSGSGCIGNRNLWRWHNCIYFNCWIISWCDPVPIGMISCPSHAYALEGRSTSSSTSWASGIGLGNPVKPETRVVLNFVIDCCDFSWFGDLLLFGFVFDLWLVLVLLIVGIYCSWMLLPWDLLLSRFIIDIHVCFMLISWLVQIHVAIYCCSSHWECICVEICLCWLFHIVVKEHWLITWELGVPFSR